MPKLQIERVGNPFCIRVTNGPTKWSNEKGDSQINISRGLNNRCINVTRDNGKSQRDYSNDIRLRGGLEYDAPAVPPVPADRQQLILAALSSQLSDFCDPAKVL
jgi:hypothetical protein